MQKNATLLGAYARPGQLFVLITASTITCRLRLDDAQGRCFGCATFSEPCVSPFHAAHPTGTTIPHKTGQASRTMSPEPTSFVASDPVHRRKHVEAIGPGPWRPRGAEHCDAMNVLMSAGPDRRTPRWGASRMDGEPEGSAGAVEDSCAATAPRARKDTGRTAVANATMAMLKRLPKLLYAFIPGTAQDLCATTSSPCSTGSPHPDVNIANLWSALVDKYPMASRVFADPVGLRRRRRISRPGSLHPRHQGR